jgi:cell division protein FtsL
MATASIALPKAKRRSKARRATVPAAPADIFFLKRIDNSRLVREPDRETRRECFGLLGLGVLVFFFVLLIAWQHFQCVRYGYQIESVKSQRETLKEWNHQLRLERAGLEDPQRIDVLARKRLGLEPFHPDQVTWVDGANRPRGVPGVPEFARDFSAVNSDPGGQ